jgi:hypothetical protein
MGTIAITVTPESLNAGWSLSGPDEYSTTGTDSQTIPDLVVGSYTITWEAVEGYVTPAEETATLVEGEIL